MTVGRRRLLATAGTAIAGGCLTSPRRRSALDTDRYDHGDGTVVGFVGDVMLGRNLDERYGDGGRNPASVWSDVRPRLESLDGVFCNLECTLSTRGERFPDRAYYFRADPDWAVPALDGANVRFAALANNHVLDFGEPALRDTLAALDDGGIAHAGAGETATDARRPALVTVGDVDVAVVSFADHYAEYAATADRPGTAYLECDPEDPDTRAAVDDALERASERDPDLLVASLHWGPNWVEYPDDRYREFGRWLVDRGVDLVHGHSAHVVQGVERYGEGVILHDAGDFVDDYVVKPELRNDRSFLFEVHLGDAGDLEQLRLVPVVVDDYAVHAATDADASWLHETMRERSAPFDTSYERDGDDLLLSL